MTTQKDTRNGEKTHLKFREPFMHGNSRMSLQGLQKWAAPFRDPVGLPHVDGPIEKARSDVLQKHRIHMNSGDPQ